MAAFESCPKHNMVAYLEKYEGNAEFHEIMDFLLRSSIRYALTTVSITEASIRRDLLFNVVDGIDCLTTADIYANLPLIGNLDAKKKFLMYPRFVQVFLDNQLKDILVPLESFPVPVLTKKVYTNMSKKGLKFSGKLTPLFPNMMAQVAVEEGEGSGTPTEPQTTPSPTQHSVGDQTPESSFRPEHTQIPRLDLEGSGGSQGDQAHTPNDSPLSGGHTSERAEGGIKLLKKRVKVLERRKTARTSGAHIFKVGKSKKHAISQKKVSKQGRKSAKSKQIFEDTTFDHLDAGDQGRQSDETEKMNLSDDIVVVEEMGSGEKGGDTVSTVVPIVSTTAPEVSTAPSTISTEPFQDEDMLLADVLVQMKDAKLKGVAIRDLEETETERPARSILTLKPLPKIDPKYKGKGILEEEPESVKVKSKDQVQIRIDDDHELAVRWTQEEQEKYTIEERAKLLVEYFENRKKQLAEERAAAIRSRPPTRTQLKSLMMTYLKHTDFVPIGSEKDERMIDKMNKKAAGVDEEEVLEERDSTKSKRQKTDSDLEEEEKLKTFLAVVPNEEEEVDYEVLDKRFPIVDWKSEFYHFDRYGVGRDYYRVFKSDGSSRYIKTFTEMVTRFDRLNLHELHELTFYENCGVHILLLEDDTEIPMLAEKRYPLAKETIERMLVLGLTVESVSDVALDLIRIVMKQIEEM
ncbi:hypothetical protein Tco_1105135 [Tanacetum coccineum]